MLVGRLTSFQIQAAMTKNRSEGLFNIAVVPLGSIEQHGPLLPLNTDSIIAESTAREIDLREQKRLFIYPCLQYTNAESGMAFAGGVSMSHDSVRKILRDICHSLIRQKYDLILFIDSHSPNRSDLLEISHEIVSQSFQAAIPFPIIVIGLDQFYSKIAEKFDINIGRHADWFEAFLFRQSGGADPEGDPEEIDPFPSKISGIPGMVGIPIQYRSTCGIIGKMGDGHEVSEIGAEIWQYYLNMVHDDFKIAVSEFYKNFPMET